MIQLNMHFSEDERFRNLRNGALAAIVTQLVRISTQTGSVILLSRLLTPVDFGTYAMASPVLAFAGLFQDLGLGHATVQKDKLTQNELSALFWVNLSVGAVLAVTQVALSPFVASFYSMPNLAPLTSGMSVTLLLSGADVQHLSLLTRQMRFWTLAGLESAAALTGLLTSAVVAFVYHTYWAILAGSLASGVVLAGGAWLSSGWLPSRPGSIRAAREMLSFGFGVTGYNLAEFLSRNTDAMLIGKAWGAAPLGAYNRAYRLLLFPLQQVSNPMVRIMLPTLSGLLKEPERYREAFRRAVLPALLLVLPGVAFMIASADRLVETLLGGQWSEAAPIFVALGIAGLLQTCNSPATWLFLSQGRAKEYMRWGVFNVSTSIFAFLCGLPFGPIGVASAYSISECVRTPILWWLVGRSGPVRHQDLIRVVGPHLAGALASLLSVCLLHRWLLARLIDGIPDLAASVCVSYAVSLTVVALFPGCHGEMWRYAHSVRRG